MSVNELENRKQLQMLQLQLTGFAKQWYKSLPNDKEETFDHAKAASEEYFVLNQSMTFSLKGELNNMQQLAEQSARDFALSVLAMATGLGLNDKELLSIIIRALHPLVSVSVQTANPKTVDGLHKREYVYRDSRL